MIKKYRKKPVIIEAILFIGDNWQEIQKWMYKSGSKRFKSCETNKRGEVVGIIIKTLEGKMKADIGDYVIKGISGEFYPCKPDIFEKTYEEVSDD